MSFGQLTVPAQRLRPSGVIARLCAVCVATITLLSHEEEPVNCPLLSNYSIKIKAKTQRPIWTLFFHLNSAGLEPMSDLESSFLGVSVSATGQKKL